MRGLWLLVLILLPAAAPAGGPAVPDDLGRTVRLEASAQRIVSLAPHATELLFAAGAGERVVGAVSYSDHPPAARDIPRVGSYDAVDYERILALEPDLVVAWVSGNGEGTVERLESLGLAVYASEPRRLTDVPLAIERFGTLAGTETAAREAGRAFRRRHARLRGRYADRPTVRVFYQLWDRPLMTMNGEHLISRVIRLCGGENVFAGLDPLVPTVDVEAVLQADPEAIVASGMDEERPEWLDAWRRWPGLTAVANGHLFHVPPDIIQRHSPRVLDGAERLCRQLEQVRRQREGRG